MKKNKRAHFLMKLESYEGEDTFVRCGDETQDYIYCIVSIDDDGDAEIIDSGYRSRQEAISAWGDKVGF
jgi:hypothetical protein